MLMLIQQKTDHFICMSNRFYNIPTFIKLMLVILILSSILITNIHSNQVYYGTMSFPRSNMFGKSKDLNTLYSVGEDLKIYRINYTRSISSSSFNYNYTTAHLKKIRAIAISPSEKYFATGSEDYSIQIVESFKRKQKCYFSAYNQIRALVFHPKNDQILFTGSVDDSIRKYNLTDCKLITEKAIGASVHSMISNDDGTFLAFGTYQGHVGKIDENLTIFDLSLNAHKLTVLYMFFTYHDYYISIGDDNVVILWKAGFQISSFGSLAAKKLKTCAIFQQYDLIATYRAFSCMESDGGTCFTMLVTNSTFARWSNHICAPSSSNWVDFIRLSTDQQVWAYHYGTTLQFQRIFQDPNSLCNAGINHLMVFNPTRTCRFCGYILPGCHFCVDGYCTGCGIATYPQGDGCTNCPSWCSDCSSASRCSVCAVGYQRNGGANTICKTAISQQGCFQIQWSGNNGNGFGGSNKCMIAGNGYYVTTSRDCQKCEVYVPYCMQCTASTAPLCLTCRTGYFLNAYNKCPSCNNSMPGCLSCFNSTTCLKCAVAFKYNGANLQCSNCLGSCQTCLTFYDQCSTCYRTQNRIISGDKCICKSGYFDNSATGNYTCPLCSSVLTFCFLCNNSNVCTQCQQNYFLYDTGTKTQCQTCDKYCQTCNGRSDNCTSCNDQTFFRMLVASTCVCKPGYVSVGGSVPCLPCSKLNIGCTDCANQTYCNSCENGYYLKVNGTTRFCQLCPYYCPSCNISVFGVINCISCPMDTHRTLVNGTCPCDSEYFDDNRTLICQKCADVLSDCLTCQNRTKCTTCAPGMFTDSTRSFCASCNPICLTCGAFYDICATCDPATNRVLSNNKCVCQSFTYEKDGKCIPCSDEISNCISCQNPYICTGCKRGYTLQQDLKGCIDCQGSMNGCSSCISPKNCTSCKNPFSLIHYRCRCPIDQYTSTSLWGKCKSYGIPGLKSRLGVQIQAHQHQNNSLIVFIRFRAKTLYVLGKKVNESIKLSINGVACEINFDYIDNNKVKIRTQLNRTFVKPNVTVTFLKDVFYNQDLLTLSDINETVVPARLYLSQNHQVQSYQAMRQVLRYTFYILKWVFFGFSIIGQGHLLFPFVVFIQLMPIFLMLNMSLPPNLSMTLDAMLSFQVKSVIPMMNMKSNFFVILPPMTYDYYSLYDFILLGKIGDMLLVIFVNVMTKFDEGIVRMFPPGKIRRYLYQSLVRRGYAVMSLCLLAFQPSLLLLSGVYINYDQWQSSQQIFNYCCCLFVFGFYLAYNFNHASNLQGGKLMKNIENQNCFFGINSQEPTAPRTTLFILATDFWMVASIHLVGPMIYFSVSILMLFIRFLMHLKRDFYIGRIQFAIRTFSNIFLIAIYSLMFVFYLGQSKIDLEINIAEMLGIVSTTLILLYLFLYIVEKILYTLKLQADFIEQKVVKNEKGQKVVVFDTEGVENINGQVKNEKQMQNQNKMQQLIAATFNPGKTFSSNAFKKKQEKEANKQGDTIKQESNYPMMDKNPILFTEESQDKGMVRNLSDKANQFFSNSIANKTATSKFSRVKTANTSKYAQNHLQLRYKAQGILTKKPDVFEQD